jgi:hypothetical protein
MKDFRNFKKSKIMNTFLNLQQERSAFTDEEFAEFLDELKNARLGEKIYFRGLHEQDRIRRCPNYYGNNELKRKSKHYIGQLF